MFLPIKKRGIMVILGCLCLLTACITKQPSLQGKIIRNRYYAPDNLFSVQMPIQPFYNGIDEKFDPNGIPTVIFANERGELVRIEVLMLSTKDVLSLYFLPDYVRARFFKGLYDHMIMPVLKQPSPDAATIYEELLAEDESGYFAIADLPKASTLIDNHTNERCDAKRGYLISLIGNQIVLISMQDVTDSNDIIESLEQVKNRLLNRLQQIRGSYQNSLS